MTNKQYKTIRSHIPNYQESTKQLPELRAKSQLNKIIIGTSGKPDYLAINIYWDTLRSWYNPNKTYKKDGNVLHITKLKTKGIFLNYQN